MKSFYNFFEAAEDQASQEPKRVSNDAVTVFGRHNPPHMGHKLTLDRAHDIASNVGDVAPGDQKFYTSRSMDPKKNPLPYQMKVNFLQKMFPEHAKKWDTDPEMNTILKAAQKAHGQGYKNFHFVGGGDRRQGMEDLMRRYNGQLYNFDNIYSHSAGERDELGTGDDPIAKLSASRMRKFALDDNFDEFQGGLPNFSKDFTMEDAKSMFDSIKMFMQKNEEWEVDYRSHRQTLREKYATGRLYNRGDVVESLTSGLVGEVHRRGANHLICVTEDGIMFKSFIHDVQAI
jgi:hypothetical protein